MIAGLSFAGRATSGRVVRRGRGGGVSLPDFKLDLPVSLDSFERLQPGSRSETASIQAQAPEPFIALECALS